MASFCYERALVAFINIYFGHLWSLQVTLPAYTQNLHSVQIMNKPKASTHKPKSVESYIQAFICGPPLLQIHWLALASAHHQGRVDGEADEGRCLLAVGLMPPLEAGLAAVPAESS